MLFKDVFLEYLENLKLEDGRNIPIKTRQLHQHIVPYFGEFELSEINRFDIERFKRYLLDQELKESTVNRYLAVLSHIFHKAVEWDWLVKVPCKIIKYRENSIRTRYLSKDEIQRLLMACEEDYNPIIEPFVRIALGTAMRRYEILSIRLEHIDLAHREIYIPIAKTGARNQPMTASLVSYLENYIKVNTKPGQEFLFPSPKARSGHREEIEKPFQRVLEQAGLDRKEVCRHTLRHTAITHLVQAGVDLPTVQRFSGHRSIQMVFRYSHQSREHLQSALDKMDERIQF